MKKGILKRSLIGLVLLSLLIMPVMALAQQLPSNDSDIVTTPNNVDVLGSLNNILNLLFTILLIAAAIFIVIAGFYFVTAQGSAERIQQGRNMLTYALMGVAVAIIAKGLVFLMCSVLGVSCIA